MFRFENLEIWKLAMEYGKDCYVIARQFPQIEQYGLGDQLRRATVSISNNIAEGSVGSSANFKKYLITAVGSALETVTILHFALQIGYIGEQVKTDMHEKAEKLIRKIQAFSRTLNG
jgi:four helix bundle protein